MQNTKDDKQSKEAGGQTDPWWWLECMSECLPADYSQAFFKAIPVPKHWYSFYPVLDL